MAVDPRYRTIEESALSVMTEVFGPILNRAVDVKLIDLDDASADSLAGIFEETPVVVETPLEGMIDAVQYFLFSKKSAAGITDLMVMGDGTAPFDETESLDGIAEAANQIVGAQATTWGDELKADIRSSGAQGSLQEIGDLNVGFDDYVQATFQIEVGDWGEDTFAKLIPRQLMDVLADLLVGGGEEEDEEMGDPFGGAATQARKPPKQAAKPAAAKPSVKKAEFGDFDTEDLLAGSLDTPQNLDLLLDISLPVTIELGRTQMLIRDVLEIGPGSVIELQKLSGEPVDLYINDKRFALGEVVVIDENFGIRITELLSVEDRIKALK